jgi:hypothetical protein
MRSRLFPLAIIFLLTFLLTPICFVALQTRHSTQAAFASGSQDRDPNKAPEACPVTKHPGQPFVPPPPYWRDNHPNQFWYGTDSLWTLLGSCPWNIHGNPKLTYWHRGFDWRKEPQPELTVIAKRLDRAAPPVAAGGAVAVFVTTERAAMMVTGFDIPSAGCWKITAQYRGNELSFIVSVQP